MAKLINIVVSLKEKIPQTQLPPDLENRVNSMFEEAERLAGGSMTNIAHFEQIVKYIEWVIDLPWSKRTQDVLDLVKAEGILHKNHYGLEPVKQRILEYLAVLKLQTERGIDKHMAKNKLMRAPILCFVGLVGTGKTTLAYSIAQAMGRRFVRIPFGGMSDV